MHYPSRRAFKASGSVMKKRHTGAYIPVASDKRHTLFDKAAIVNTPNHRVTVQKYCEIRTYHHFLHSLRNPAYIPVHIRHFYYCSVLLHFIRRYLKI